MSTAFTQYIDLAQVVLYLFSAFLAGFIIYLHRENKREGYPLENERSGPITVQGWPSVPAPKEYLLADGSTVYAPRAEPNDSARQGTPIGPWPGAPLEPDGDPMIAGVGPGAYAERQDIPDATVHGTPKIVPLRAAEFWHLEERDHPVGMTVIGADGASGGVVRMYGSIRRNISSATSKSKPTRRATSAMSCFPPHLPAFPDQRERTSEVDPGRQFASVPAHKKPDMVTRLEEEKIFGFYGAGTSVRHAAARGATAVTHNPDIIPDGAAGPFAGGRKAPLAGTARAGSALRLKHFMCAR